ncbi:hypothetical protein [Chryseobacterium arthrosphaerae]|uniref:hypothetical protein n=1 Tax=Chryseobacterium arthrosphaerae TaxID=651561 RepID=UPI0031E405E1
MKTRLIILTAAVAALLYSCTSDRDETIPVTEKTKKPELKLNPGQLSREELEVKSDSIITRDLNSNGPTDPTDPIDPNEGGDPKDLPIPPRR